MDLTSLVNTPFDNSIASDKSAVPIDIVNSWWLMGSPMSVIVILITYLMFVLKIGPNYMKDKKPYQLQHILTLFNGTQVVASWYIVYQYGKLIVNHGLLPRTCALDTEDRISVASAIHFYLVAKVSELLDTIFYVLRKKDNQISFLHVYHHTLMVFGAWCTLEYEPNLNLNFLACMNGFVHVVMYSYYGLSSYPSLAKYLWWKRYITKLQLAQFIIGMIQFVVASAISECTPSKITFTSVFINGFLFIYLFGSFYWHNYTRKSLQSNYKKTK